jgi:hypothetical protein
MGNRALVIFANKDWTEFSPAVYLHWNGGPESVYAFLDELDRRKIRGGDDLSYQTARFIHTVGDFLDQDEAQGLSLGVFDGPKKLDKPEEITFHGDNGAYVVYRGEGERSVRRFEGKTELSAKEVERERIEAYKSDYNTGEGTIASTFLELRPKISKYG